MTRPRLRDLAERVGILGEYEDVAGVRHETKDGTREALVDAMGLDGSTEEASSHALERMEAAAHARIVAGVRVARSHEARRLSVRAGESHGARLEWSVEVALESADALSCDGTESLAVPGASFEVELPRDLPHGHHRVSVRVTGGGAESLGDRKHLPLEPRHRLPRG